MQQQQQRFYTFANLSCMIRSINAWHFNLTLLLLSFVLSVVNHIIIYKRLGDRYIYQSQNNSNWLKKSILNNLGGKRFLKLFWVLDFFNFSRQVKFCCLRISKISWNECVSADWSINAKILIQNIYNFLSRLLNKIRYRFISKRTKKWSMLINNENDQIKCLYDLRCVG